MSTTALESALAARDAIDRTIAELGGASASGSLSGLVIGTDDPDTSPLNVDGSWTSPLLARLCNIADREFPDGYGPEEIDLSGKTVRRPRTWPKAIILQRVLRRGDLTETQRNTIQQCNSAAMVSSMIDTGVSLSYRTLAAPLTGGYVAILAMAYDDNLKRIDTDLRQHWLQELKLDVSSVAG